jgi:predicted nucleotidyltransferase
VVIDLEGTRVVIIRLENYVVRKSHGRGNSRGKRIVLIVRATPTLEN